MPTTTTLPAMGRRRGRGCDGRPQQLWPAMPLRRNQPAKHATRRRAYELGLASFTLHKFPLDQAWP